MLFNSFDFAVFLPLVFLLYWSVFSKNIRRRNIFLLAASYVFYGFWDWRFLGLIALTSVSDFFLAHFIHLTPGENVKRRKLLLILSFAVNLSVLGFFKYCNFFIESFVSVFRFLGRDINCGTLDIILPVGISFYTFQSLSYTLDVYYKRLEPTGKLFDFMAFVAFFPQLVAGPIERARNLLPQFASPKVFDYDDARYGLILMVSGFFKKIVVADRLGIYVDGVYANPAEAAGLPALMGVLFFAFQLYLDFSAYSEIAIGTARLFGFRLTLNFRRPYLSGSFKEFWKRWHITLSSWFMDYVYIPLGGNRKNYVRNIIVVFLLSGLWHGASWNFVVWGLSNAVFLLVFDRFLHKGSKSRGVGFKVAPLIVFSAWALSLVFFRAPAFSDALTVFGNLGFSGSENLYGFGLNAAEFKFALLLIAAIVSGEIFGEARTSDLYRKFAGMKTFWRWGFYIIAVLAIIYLGSYGTAHDNSFIYFQF